MMNNPDARWQEYKALIYKFGVEMGELIKSDPELSDWKEQMSQVKADEPMARITAIADQMIADCYHSRIRAWMQWSTNNSWYPMVYTAWYQVTQV